VRQNVDLLLDLTGLGDRPSVVLQVLEQTFSPGGVGWLACSATALLPPGILAEDLSARERLRIMPATKPVAAANDALRDARDGYHHLLIILGSTSPTSEAAGALVQVFDMDPYWGSAVPRYSDIASSEIYKLSRELGDPTVLRLPRRVLAEIPESYIVPEMLSPCLMLRDTVVSNLGLFDEAYETLAGALLHYLSRARRCGFRCVICNAAVVQVPEGGCLYPVPNRPDVVRLHKENPDLGRAKAEFREHGFHAHESLLARAFSSEPPLGRSLLLDIRGVPDYVNGTAEAALSTCDGLFQTASNWEITLWAGAGPAQFHKLAERYPKWKIISDEPERGFAAALRLSQPWHLSTLIELHRAALFTFCCLLDTISLDILFESPRYLRETWEFLASYADGILYISQYTRDRFATRFPASITTPGHVSYLSFNPDDYGIADSSPPSRDRKSYILLIGNGYDHKHIGPTADLLAGAFPFRCFKALGIKNHLNPLVDVLESGPIPQEDMDRLFAEADLIVFPSFYEGFGFPVLKGLSLGRTVIARRSSLLLEIAAHYRGPGRLLSFSTPAELVDLVGGALHGASVPEMQLGTAVGPQDRPMNWNDIAGGVIEFMEERLRRPEDSRWCIREKAVRQFGVFSA